jgi:DNA mismatch endonuclease (patch repair protein)
VPDRLTSAQRSAHMARIRRSNTRPECAVRGLLHGLGYRFRVQFAGVPGRPDVAFPGRRQAIWIHGCFWHAHESCQTWRMPRTRPEFWAAKFARNRERDQRLLDAAVLAGWDCLVLWECELKDGPALARRLQAFLGETNAGPRARRSLVFSADPSSLRGAV